MKAGSGAVENVGTNDILVGTLANLTALVHW